jgi:hypothetical protein
MEPGPPPPLSRMLVVLLVGVILGATATGAAWTFTSLVGGGAAPGVGTHGDVVAACDVIGRVTLAETHGDLSLEMNNRIGAAQALVQAAATSDTRYTALHDALTKTYQAIQLADVEQVNAGLGDVRAECGRV